MPEPCNVDRHLIVDGYLVELGRAGGRFSHGACHALLVTELLPWDLVCDYHSRMVLSSIGVACESHDVLKGKCLKEQAGTLLSSC